MRSDRHARLALQLAQQLEDLRLHRHVQRRRRLVGDQQLGLAGKRHRDHHALAHAARELVRILVEPALGRGDADLLEQLDGARRAASLRDTCAVQAQRLGDLPADRVARGSSAVIGSWKIIAMRRRALAHLRRRNGGQIAVEEQDAAAFDDAGGRAAKGP